MLNFLEWNDALAGHFFREENAGKTVYLYVTPELLNELGGAYDDSVAGFIVAMKAGPPWATRAGLCQKALQSLTDWRARHLPFPPYIGYLALFVLAAGHEAGFAPHAYYPRLRALLGEPQSSGQYPSFDKMLYLWSDLEQWASREKQGALGLVRPDISGSWLHVGLPVAQAILTETERQYLQRLFNEAELDPEDPPVDTELARIVRINGAGKLRSRTLKALSLEKAGSEYTSVLLDRIFEELESWTPNSRLEAGSTNSIRGTIIFGLQVDSTARLAKVQVHIKLRNVELETIAATFNGREYTCQTLTGGYSTALIDESCRHLDGGQFDWSQAITLQASGDLTLRAPACNVRIFKEGSLVGMSGWLETSHLDPSRPFAVAATGNLVERVRAWGKLECSDFRERDVSGLPVGWALFTANRATSDELIREHVPKLGFARGVRIRLEGGLRLPQSAQYFFRFAPPVIRLDGTGEDAEVWFNEEIAHKTPTGTFIIPDNLLEEDTISVCCKDRDVSRRRLIYLRDHPHQEDNYGPQFYTPNGLLADATLDSVQLSVCGIPSQYVDLPPAKVPLVALDIGFSAILIGSLPGDIAEYQPGAPPDWEPVWAVIRHRRNLTALFIGASLIPPDVSQRANQRLVRQWKDLLWRQRKRIDSPGFEPARVLWLAYQAAARDV